MEEHGAARRWLAAGLWAAGLGALGWAVTHLPAPPAEGWIYLVAAMLLVAAGQVTRLPVPARPGVAVSLTPVATLVIAAAVPPPWAIVCAVCGIAVASFATGTERSAVGRMAAGGVNVCGAVAGIATVWLAGVTITQIGSAAGNPAGLVLAGAVVVAVVEVLSTAVAASMTGSPWWQAVWAGWTSRLPVGAGQVAAALLAIGLIDVQHRLLLLLPAAMFVAYAIRAHRATLRAERRTWERLATLTDALHATDTTAVVHTGVRGAVSLFDAAAVEVEWDDVDGRRLVRADQSGVCFDGPAAQAPPLAGRWAAVHVVAGQATDRSGQLRLATRGGRALSARNVRMLGVFSAALGTCVESALAHSHVVATAARLEHQATHDPLTGLANRRYLLDAAARQLSRGDAALLFLDLAGFKEVNDTLGHDAGDRLLVAVAARLRQAVAADGQLAARLGGDEFAVLLSGLTPAAASDRGRQIQAAVCQSVDVDGVQMPVRGSVGLAVSTAGMTATELLRRADIAMYQAKETGSPIMVFDPGNDTADGLRLELMAQLPDALAGGQVRVLYEPILRLATGEAVAARAVPVWEHPRHGVLPPTAWYPMAMRANARAFTDLVVSRALAAVAIWRDHGNPVPVEIGVSPRSLRDPRFPVAVLAALAHHRVQPGDLIVDVVQMPPSGPDPVLDRLRAAGVKFVLDRFGTSTTPLAVLDRMTFHGLRVDRSFIVDLPHRTAAAVVKGAVRLGRDLTIAVCADGIDTAGRRQAAHELGCQFGHGTLFGSPLEAHELAQRMRSGLGGMPGRLAHSIVAEASVVALHGRAS